MVRNQGKKGILALIGSCVALFWAGTITYGYLGVMGSQWIKMFSIGEAATSSTMYFLLISLGLWMWIVGKVQERMGTRKTITIGPIVFVFGFIISAYATSIYVVYIASLVFGIGDCLVYVPGLTAVQNWFPKRRGLLAGILMLVFGSAGGLTSPIISYILESLGYLYTNFMMASIVFVTGVTAAQLTGTPKELSFKEGSAHFEADRGESLTLRETVRTRSFWLIWLIWALAGAAGISMVMLSIPFGRSMGLTAGVAVYILTAFNITNGLGRFLSGFLSDLVERSTVMMLSFIVAGLAYLFMPYVDGLAISFILALMIGYGFGALFGVSAPLMTDCFGLKHFGSIYGGAFTAYGFLAGLLGPFLSGLILDATNSFLIPFTYFGIFFLTSAVLVQYIKPEI